MYFGNYRWHLSIVMLSQYDGMRAIACTNSSLLDVGPGRCVRMLRNNLDVMSAKLLEAISSRLCSHQFAWPRRRPSGDYYQVCLLCGVEYTYDWGSMTRTGRSASQEHGENGTNGNHRTRRRSNWTPRARRLRVELPVSYRQPGAEQWHAGTVENVSQSGVLLNGTLLLPHDTDLELVFEMPQEITGQPNRRVLCRGYVVRAVSLKNSPNQFTLAAAISGYSFLPQEQ